MQFWGLCVFAWCNLNIFCITLWKINGLMWWQMCWVYRVWRNVGIVILSLCFRTKLILHIFLEFISYLSTQKNLLYLQRQYSNLRERILFTFSFLWDFFKANPISLHLSLTLKGIQYHTNTKYLLFRNKNSVETLFKTLWYQFIQVYIAICFWTHILICNEILLKFPRLFLWSLTCFTFYHFDL